MHLDTELHLKRILIREATSLLQYLREAWPWWAAAEQETAARLQAMITEERRGMHAVADFLNRRRIGFDTGQFPEEFTATNYLALDHLLPRLVAYQKRRIAELEQDLSQLADDDTRAAVAPLLEVKRRHLTELEQLAAEHSGTRAVSTLR